jgi:arylsulfatase A-like enzyme
MNDRPNIVLVMTDQQRADFFKSEGFALDTMPFTEAFGARGARFEHAYTPMPVCVPARTSTFTGRFPKATHVRENSAAEHVYRTQDLVAVLRAQGYSINIAGKNHSYLQAGDFDCRAFYMHLGKLDAPERPRERAFDAWLQAGGHKVYLEPAPFPLECQLPYRIVSDAISCLEQRDPQQPFFLWLSFPEPHNPYQVPEPYFSLFSEAAIPDRIAGPEAAQAKGGKWAWLQRLIAEQQPDYDTHWRRYRANYCGMLRLIDDQIRRFVGYLDAHALRARIN